jgi:hypothetical protein
LGCLLHGKLLGYTFGLSGKEAATKPRQMKLQDKINSNPYLKVSNCTDISDIEYAIDELRKLDAEFGKENKTLLKLWGAFLEKKKKLEAKASASNLNPVFIQALAPFGIR